MINEQIRDKEVRLIGEDGQQLGIMSAREAYKLALEAELKRRRGRMAEEKERGLEKAVSNQEELAKL